MRWFTNSTLTSSDDDLLSSTECTESTRVYLTFDIFKTEKPWCIIARPPMKRVLAKEGNTPNDDYPHLDWSKPVAKRRNRH